MGVELADEVALVLDEERYRDAVGQLAPEHRLEALAAGHRPVLLAHRLLPSLTRAMVSHARRAVATESRRTGTTCAVP